MELIALLVVAAAVIAFRSGAIGPVGSLLPKDETHPLPPRPLPPGPTPDAALPPAPCIVEKTDGPYDICIYAQGKKYGFLATNNGKQAATGGGLLTKTEALVEAWQMLAATEVMVVQEPLGRYGAVLLPNGTFHLAEDGYDDFYTRAAPIWVEELAKGETDPAGLILAVFLSSYPEINPLRMKPGGGTLAEAAARVEPFKGEPQKALPRIFGESA